MRIAITFPQFHRGGGVERILLEAANFLAGRRHDVHVFAHEWDERALDTRIRRHLVPRLCRGDLSEAYGFSNRCERMMRSAGGRFDVQATCGVLSPPGAVVWVQSVHREWIRISRRLRDLRGRFKQRLNPFHPMILRKEHACFARRRYRRLIALTGRVRDELTDHYGVPEKDIDVLSNGYAPAEFNTQIRCQREQVREELGLGERDRVVIFVANELERKGFRPLLEAVGRIDDPNVKLLAVGRFNPRSYMSRIEALGLSSRVLMPGPTREVARYYAASDVFALPTHYEAWGLVIVEAMACGLPVLTSRLAGASVAVREGETGYLLDDPTSTDEVHAKIIRLLDESSGYGTDDADRIASSVTPYAWPNILERYEQVLAANVE